MRRSACLGVFSRPSARPQGVYCAYQRVAFIRPARGRSPRPETAAGQTGVRPRVGRPRARARVLLRAAGRRARGVDGGDVAVGGTGEPGLLWYSDWGPQRGGGGQGRAPGPPAPAPTGPGAEGRLRGRLGAARASETRQGQNFGRRAPNVGGGRALCTWVLERWAAPALLSRGAPAPRPSALGLGPGRQGQSARGQGERGTRACARDTSRGQNLPRASAGHNLPRRHKQRHIRRRKGGRLTTHATRRMSHSLLLSFSSPRDSAPHGSAPRQGAGRGAAGRWKGGGPARARRARNAGRRLGSRRARGRRRIQSRRQHAQKKPDHNECKRQRTRHAPITRARARQ